MSIFINGNVITLGKDKLSEAFCVRNGRFAAVGSKENILSIKEAGEEVIDLKGQTVLPGLIDAHMHFLNYAVFKDRINLASMTSISEMIEKSKEYIKTRNIFPGLWILARGWNDNHFDEQRVPSKKDLDKISTEHPIFFSRVCGHIGVANSKALELLNISRDTENPEGGIIDIKDGIPTGILRENAMNLVFDVIPPMEKDDIKRVLMNAFEDALKVGLTSIHTEDMGQAGSLKSLVSAYRELDEEGKLPIRFTLQLHLPSVNDIEEARELGLKTGEGDGFLKIGALKLYQDGSLGGRTALMAEPYEDTDSSGVEIFPQEKLNILVESAHRSGFQLCIHCIGDKAAEMVLDSFERIKSPEARPVIIHCQFTNDKLLSKFKELNVVANVQPSFVMTDWPIVDKAVGKDRSSKSYAWKDMLNFNIPVAFSSDAPIESFNPFYGLYAAVTRKDLKGNPESGWHESQKLSLEEALKCFTLGSAYMNFQENELGSIEAGKNADFIVISKNINSIAEEEIKDIEVIQTYVNGTKVYEINK